MNRRISGWREAASTVTAQERKGMRFRRRAAVMLLAVVAAFGIAAGTGAVAEAASAAICTHGGGGKCLNDWNGGGINNPVKMGQSGWPNQNFGTAQLTSMCGSGRVTHTCPFQVGSGLNDANFDDIIVAVVYIPSHLCIGSGQNDNRGLLEACPDASGNGGGWGTVMVERQNFNNCFSQNGDVRLVDKHWSDVHGTNYELTGSETNGDQTFFTSDVGQESCWGTG